MAGRTGAFLRGSNQGLGRLAQALAMGGQSEEQAFQNSMAGQSKIMQALAAAQRDQVEAGATAEKAAVLAGRPSLYDEQVALQSGQSVPTVRGYRKFVQTGQMPQVELQGPATPEGGALMADLVPPEARSKISAALQRLAPFLSDSGDIGMKGLADAMGAYQQQDRAAAVRGGGLDLPTVGQQEAALDGKPLVAANEFGSTNLFTGKQDATGPAAQRFGAYRDSTTAAQRANATKDYASAAHSNAQATSERANGGSGKPPAGFRWTASGDLEAIPGGPGDKQTTASEGERKAGSLLMRLRGSQQQMLAAVGATPDAEKPVAAAEFVRMIPWVGGDTPANALTPEARQQIEAAQLDMLDAALTLGTGAAYTKEQLRGYAKSFFPQILDKPKTLEDKKVRLANVIRAAEIAAGRMASKVVPAPPSAPSGGASGSWAGAAPTAAGAAGAAQRNITVEW